MQVVFDAGGHGLEGWVGADVVKSFTGDRPVQVTLSQLNPIRNAIESQVELGQGQSPGVDVHGHHVPGPFGREYGIDPAASAQVENFGAIWDLHVPHEVLALRIERKGRVNTAPPWEVRDQPAALESAHHEARP